MQSGRLHQNSAYVSSSLHTAQLSDDLSSDLSPHIATPSSSSRTNSDSHSPSRGRLHAPAASSSAHRQASISSTGSGAIARGGTLHAVDRSHLSANKSTANQTSLASPSSFDHADDDDGFDAWDDGSGELINEDDPLEGEDMDRINALQEEEGGAMGGGSKSSQPLLGGDDRGRPSYDSPAGSQRPPFHARRRTFRSRSPDYQAASDTRRKYIISGLFLGVSLVTFVVQTEATVHITQNLGWNKSYCMLWLTHGSWSLLWPVTFLILRIQKRNVPFDSFWRRHKQLLRTTAQMVETQSTDLSAKDAQRSPIPYILRTTAFVTTALTIAGGSWYLAVNLTTASDLTAIYNCSAFFAYAFSIPLLGDRLRWSKVFSVGVAIAGVLIVAYGGAGAPKHGTKSGGSVPGGGSETPGDSASKEGATRLFGNIVIGIGSVLYGLYEVLYKKFACPPEGTSPGRGMIFALSFGSLIGSFTLFVLWFPLPILHYTGLEPFEMPSGDVAFWLLISVLMNATFSGSFLVLISLTSPVLSSVAALLTIFLVAITDWLRTGEPLTAAAIVGGLLIIGAFLLLSWDTYKETIEDRKRKEQEAEGPIDDDDD